MQSRRYPSICRCQLLAAARGPCGMHRIRDERSSGTNCCSLSPPPCKLLLLINVSMGKMRLRRALPKSRCPNPARPPCHRPPRSVGAVAVARAPGKKVPQRLRIANGAQIVVKQLPVDEKASKTLEISGVRTALSRRSRVYAYRHGPSMPSAPAIGCRDKWT